MMVNELVSRVQLHRQAEAFYRRMVPRALSVLQAVRKSALDGTNDQRDSAPPVQPTHQTPRDDVQKRLTETSVLDIASKAMTELSTLSTPGFVPQPAPQSNPSGHEVFARGQTSPHRIAGASMIPPS